MRISVRTVKRKDLMAKLTALCREKKEDYYIGYQNRFTFSQNGGNVC